MSAVAFVSSAATIFGARPISSHHGNPETVAVTCALTRPVAAAVGLAAATAAILVASVDPSLAISGGGKVNNQQASCTTGKHHPCCCSACFSFLNCVRQRSSPLCALYIFCNASTNSYNFGNTQTTWRHFFACSSIHTYTPPRLSGRLT
jgi:hypothetical protein